MLKWFDMVIGILVVVSPILTVVLIRLFILIRKDSTESVGKVVKHKQTIILSADDIVEALRAYKPELKIPADAAVRVTGNDYVDCEPVEISWEE